MARHAFPPAGADRPGPRSHWHTRLWHAIAGLLLVARCGAPHAAGSADLDGVIVEDLYRQAQAAYGDGQREQAVALLDSIVAMGPVLPGTWLDAAMLYCELGQQDASRALLQRIRTELNPPAGIRQFIDLRMDASCGARIVGPSFYAAGGAGWTSNANFAPSIGRITLAPSSPLPELVLAPSSQARGDGFVNLELAGELPIPGTEGWTVTGAFSDRQYRTMRGFDSALASGGVAYRKRIANGLLENQLSFGQYWLGGRPYQRFTSLQSGYWFAPQRVLGAPMRFGMEAAVSDQRYNSNPLYDADRIELRAKVEFQPTDYANALILAGPVWDRPAGMRPGGQRTGYNALMGLNLQVLGTHKLSLMFQQQSLADRAPYQPVFFGDIVRSQRIRLMSVRYAIPLHGRTQVYLQFTHQDIDDSIPLFSYKVSTGSIGLAYAY